MAEVYIWRWTEIDGRMLAQTLGCVRQFGGVASLGQPAGRILPLGWKSASEHCVISSRGHQRGGGLPGGLCARRQKIADPYERRQGEKWFGIRRSATARLRSSPFTAGSGIIGCLRRSSTASTPPATPTLSSISADTATPVTFPENTPSAKWRRAPLRLASSSGGPH